VAWLFLNQKKSLQTIDFYIFAGQDVTLPVSNAHKKNFLAHIAESYEDWQVGQADSALRLYDYYLSKGMKKGSICADGEAEWAIFEEKLREALRLRHRSYSTEKVSAAPWNPAHKLVHIGLQGEILDAVPPSNLVFLLDVSGSMDTPEKLPLLKAAFKLLVNQLSPDDRISIVVYAGAAGLVLPATPGSKKDVILEAIDKLQAGGSTAGGAGIQLAYKVAAESFLKNGNNRIILATDGDFNIGVSDTGALVRMIEEKRDQGIFLTILGFGMGNYKDGRMEQLADKGNGNYYYVDGLLEAKKVFVNDLRGTLFTIAKDVKIQVEFNPAKVKAYRLIGYETRLLAK
jgi:Ca-activated chloride channel family protein